MKKCIISLLCSCAMCMAPVFAYAQMPYDVPTIPGIATESFPEPDGYDVSGMSIDTVNSYSLSEHGNDFLARSFRVKEFACKDGSDTVLIDSELVAILQNIRDHFGAAVTVTSAYRTLAYNSQVGGSSGSYHVKGMAADIQVSGVAPAEVAKHAETIGVKGIGLYNSFVHVDSRPVKYYWKTANGTTTAVSTHGGIYNLRPYTVPPQIKMQIIDNVTFQTTLSGLKSGCEVILTLYKAGTLTDVQMAVYDGKSKITFKTNSDYDFAKVMVWNSKHSMKPLCESEALTKE